jgi:hypothetical protein
MAYQVDRYNGSFFVSVEDGTIDSTTDIRLVGKNYAGYGEVQNENFLHLLENFANNSAPPKSITGQIWFDTLTKKLKFYDGTKYRVAGGAEVSDTAPAGLTAGDFWWDSTAKQLYAWSGTNFVLVGPVASPDLGESAVFAQVVKDTLNNNHTIIRLNAGGKTIAVVSQSAFTLNTAVNTINNTTSFAIIKKGVTLVNTNNETGVTTDDHYFWGTASNSSKLGGYPASEFLRVGSQDFENEIHFFDPGFTVGDGQDLRIRIENGIDTIIESRTGEPITFRVTLLEGVDERDVAIIRSSGIVPGADATYDLGAVESRWNKIYASSVESNLTGNVEGNVVGSVRGSVLATADSQVLVNGLTKEIGYPLATLKGTLLGDVEGNLTGTAENANMLNSILPSIELPSAVDKKSVVVRSSEGNITASQFIGTSDKTDKMKIDNSAIDTDVSYRSAKTTPTANSIVARDNAGDIYANLFQGTATSARYADLAEKYLADAEYEVGTVVAVGGSAEVTACMWGNRALGVVSSNPAYMMNSELAGGTYIALKGRVPVKVTGAVKKGDRLVASNNGCAISAVPHANDVFAIALENSQDVGVKLIEAVVL